MKGQKFLIALLKTNSNTVCSLMRYITD